MRLNLSGIWLLLGVYLVAAPAAAAPRDVMIRSIDTVALVLELHNFGPADESLSGYQFCSHDEDQFRRYSSTTGLNGVTIESGTSLFIHFNNDAPADPDHLNRSSLGGFFALPLDNGPFAISLYFPPVSFLNGNTMADHLQWSIDGTDNTMADERSDEAENGGLWTDQSLWVATSADTTLIQLKSGAESTVLHSPDDYDVFGPPGAGEVPDGDIVPGTPLEVSLSGGQVTLTWGDSCLGDPDFEVYEGTLGDFTGHMGIVCSTGGALSSTFSAPIGDAFYLVVPTDGAAEGSYGADGSGTERPAGAVPCRPQVILSCQ